MTTAQLDRPTPKTHAAPPANAEAEIRTEIARWSRAVEKRDLDGIVASYLPETVLYDAIPPYRTVGAEAIKALWAQCFPYFPEKFRSEHKDLVIETSGDLAFVHGMHHFLPEPADHPCGMTWMRVTACLKRIDGRWRVLHEHVSIPFDPMTNKPAYITDTPLPPDAPTCASAAEASVAQDSVAQDSAVQAVHSVTPHLVCDDAAQAIAFYKDAFGAQELVRLPAPNGKLMHGCVRINGSTVMVVDEFPEMGSVGPKKLKGTPVTVHLSVPDADAAVSRAVAAGARVVMPLADMFWGDRYGVIEDPFGHRWSIAHTVKAVPASELATAAQQAMCGPA
jgi:uncharacterized glyoxalase superfamily protein PhnB/ketosteroid isomerase-like protein